MPSSTRSINVKRTVKQTRPEKWTQLEERVLIKMTRHLGLSEEEIARSLCRSVPAVRYRLAKIFHEHLDGRTDADSIQEVSDWILPEHHYTN
jgi:DNA-binding NarL/FixJ family response regulator